MHIPSTAPGRVEGGGHPVLSFEQCFILFCSFPLLFAFVVGGLGFELCVFVAGWRHALRSEWPFIIIINRLLTQEARTWRKATVTCCYCSIPLHCVKLYP